MGLDYDRPSAGAMGSRFTLPEFPMGLLLFAALGGYLFADIAHTSSLDCVFSTCCTHVRMFS